jgi:hypothetical protein
MISISSSIPGMPNGKPAGVKCIHLTNDFKCDIFTSIDRPPVCGQYKAEELFCGNSQKEAITILAGLESLEIVDE